MPRPGFYNDNQNRSYPFIHVIDHDNPPDGIIIDFGCMMGEGSGFIEGVHSVFLAAIRELNDTYEFEFQSDAPGLIGKALIFRRMKDAPEYQSSYAEAVFSSGLETTVMCDVSDAITESCESSIGGGMIEVAAGEVSCPDIPGIFTDRIYADGVSAELKAFLEATAECEVCSKSWMYHVATSTDMTFSEYADHCDRCSDCYDALMEKYGTACFPPYICDYLIPDDVPPWVILDHTYMCKRTTVRDAYCYDDSPWTGYLVTGDLGPLEDLIEPCTTLTFYSTDPGNVDILFLTDTTGSMGSYIRTIKDVFPIVAQSLKDSLPNVTFNWSIASYRDFEDGGNYVDGYQLDQAFTPSITAASSAILSWSAGGGGDGPEQQLAALKKISENWETTIGGQTTGAAQRMVVWAGDIQGWENGSKGHAYPKLSETIAELQSADIGVFAINSREVGRGIDGTGFANLGNPIDGRRQASAITSATEGYLYNGAQTESALEISKIIANAVVRTTSVTFSTTCNGLSGEFVVEPGTIQNLSGAYVRTVNVANAERTRSTKPEECRDHCWPFPLKEHYIACTCLEGVIRLKPGYNTNIYQEAYNNRLVLEAEVDAGEGPACGPTPLFDDEEPPRDRTTLDGGLSCGEVIRSINGVGKRFFEIAGGAGILITSVPEKNKIIVDVDMHNMAICADLPDQESLGSVSSSESSCDSSSSSSCIHP